MADIFYFSSPADPTPAHKYRDALQQRAKHSRTHRPAKMNISQHACVARFDEPTFCANDGIFFLDYFPSRPLNTLGGSHWKADDFSPSLDEDQHMPDADSLHEHRVTRDLAPDQIQARRSSSTLRSRHPRPQNGELWQEEDGRRVRFALDGEDNSEVPQFVLLPECFDTAVNSSSEISSDLLDSLALPVFQNQPGPSTQHASHLSEPLRDSTGRNGSSTLSLPAQIPTEWLARFSQVTSQYAAADEDWLPVDDARRNYDVADFLDDWHRRPMATALQPTTLRAPRILPVPVREVCCDDVAGGNIDMQGIPWPFWGLQREEVLTARALLHPNQRRALPLSVVRPRHADGPALNEDVTYGFRNYVSRHQAQHSHYQLRNVLVATDRSGVMYANKGKVYRTSLAVPSSSEIVMDLVRSSSIESGFRITCLGASRRNNFTSYQSDAVLLVGGFNGEYAIQDLNSNGSHGEGYLTHASDGIVTHIHTFNARNSGLLESAFCSNDHKLSIMDTRSQRFTNVFTYPYSINCSATSPNGRLRVLVGDDDKAMITDAEKGNVLVRLDAHNDHGFACAWADDDIHVATASQDGLSAVWDARNWSHPLRSLPSVMTCPRSVHFTDDGALVVGESEDIVSIYRASSYDKCQDIRFLGSIAGVALLDGGAEIAVANSDKTVGGLLTFERSSRSFGYVTSGEGVRHRRRLEERTLVPFDGLSDVLV